MCCAQVSDARALPYASNGCKSGRASAEGVPGGMVTQIACTRRGYADSLRQIGLDAPRACAAVERLQLWDMVVEQSVAGGRAQGTGRLCAALPWLGAG